MYQLTTHPEAKQQIAALPVEALPFYAEALGVLQLTPWNGRAYNAEHPERPMRELVFGRHGEGTVTYLILEDQQRVDVLLVQWLG